MKKNSSQAPDSPQKQSQSQNETIINILEMNADFGVPFARLLIQVNNAIYLVGMNPKVAKKYVRKMEKGYICLVNFSYSMNLRDIESEHWFKGDHPQLSLLECGTVPSAWNLEKKIDS